MTTEKKYPVRFPAPNPVTTADGRQLKTHVHDWLTRKEFEALVPGGDLVKHLCYEAVGPEHYIILIGSEEVMSCERSNAVQSLYISDFLRARDGQGERSLEEAAGIARCYEDISPDAVLFLLKLHEQVNEPVDHFEPPQAMSGAALESAMALMAGEGVTIRDLVCDGVLTPA